MTAKVVVAFSPLPNSEYNPRMFQSIMRSTFTRGPAQIVVSGLFLLLAACGPTLTVSELTSTPVAVAGTVQPGTQATEDSAPTASSLAAGPTTLFPTEAPPSPTATQTPLPSSTPEPTPTATIPAAVVELAGAALPPGFSMKQFAGVFQPTGLTFDAAGNLFVTSGDGAIHVFTDGDGDGRSDREILFAEGFSNLQGVAIHPETGLVFASSQGRIDVLQDADGDLLADSRTTLVSGLPYDWHWNNNPKFGPDGLLYVGIGSTCNVCVEEDPRSATIMRYSPAGGEGEILATGLRNPFDLAFHPLTGDLFATDNGRDDLGENEPPEELNLILPGADYGFPDCWGDNSQPGCEGVQRAVAFFQARSSANSLDFYSGDRFPPEYAGDAEAAVAYVTIFGAWDYPTPVGIQRVILRQAGDSYETEVDWFAQWQGNPLGLIVGPDGAIYVGDYALGAVYVISYGP